MDYSVFTRPRSPFYQISYYDSGGLRRFVSSKKRTADPLGYKQALDMARALAQDFRATREEIAEAGWDQWVENWLKAKFNQPKHVNSLRAELARWRFLRAFLAFKQVQAPSGVTYRLALAYVDWRVLQTTRGGKGSRTSAIQELFLLGRVMQEAVRREFVTANPLRKLGLKPAQPPEKPEITDQEEKMIREALARKEGSLPLHQRWMTISFEIAIHQGWRFRETSFPFTHLDWQAWTVEVHQKGDRWRTVPVHPGIRGLLTAIRDAGQTVSCTIPRMGTQEWSLFFNGRHDKGIVGVAPHLCFHCTRVTVISRLLRAGVSERLVMEYVGHADRTVHRKYQRVRHDQLDQCVAALTSSAAPQSRDDERAIDELQPA